MSIATIVLFISTIAWIIPIFRQYRCNLFYFFLFLGLSDPITLLLLKLFHIIPGIVAVIIAPFLFYSININRQKPFTINYLEISVFILTFILIFILPNYDIILLIIHTLILLRIIQKIILELYNNQLLNFFHLVLTFYQISVVASLIIYLNGDNQGIVLFHINLSFQILLAIFFSIFREDHPKLNYNITPVIKD